jgi:pyruvate dehydrogenase complex dehydrogenase (E1) component
METLVVRRDRLPTGTISSPADHQPRGSKMTNQTDDQALEAEEWTDAIESVIAFEGTRRADELLTCAVDTARRQGAHLPFAANTAYINTISPDE